MAKKIFTKILAFASLGVLFSVITFSIENDSVPAYSTPVTLFDYDSENDNTFTSSINLTTNLVYEDINSDQSFTLNASAFEYGNPNIAFLGGNKYSTLTGTAAGQFVVGNPNLQTLANSTNLANTKYLYGIRINKDIDLSFYRRPVVTWGWDEGGSHQSFSAFIAYSLGGDDESWTTIGNLKTPISLATAGNISFTDSDNSLLGGKSARFALIIDSNKSVPALKNFTFKIEGTAKTTLDSLSNPRFNRSGNYLSNENISHSDILFTANYLDRLEGNTLELTAVSEGVSITDANDNLLANPFSYFEAGTYTIKITYDDPSGFGVQSTTLTFNIDETQPLLTGIFAIDNNLKNPGYYQYEFYNPDIDVFPLYNYANEPDIYDLPLLESEYQANIQAGILLKTAFNVMWTYNDNSNFTSTINYPVISRNLISISLSNYQESYYVDELFSLGELVVTSIWSEGPQIEIPYHSSLEDGYFTSSYVVGATLNECGNFTNDIIYLAHGIETTESYTFIVEHEMASIFQYHFSIEDPVFGLSDKTLKGNIASTAKLDNAVDLGTNVTHTLTTYSPTSNSDATYCQLTSDGLTLGRKDIGPQLVSIATTDIAQASINDVPYTGIYKLRIDLTTTSIAEVTASVAGIFPYAYQRDGEDLVYRSFAPTFVDGNPHIYILYLPYTAIGKVNISVTNNIETPKPITISFFAYAGYSLTEEHQAKTFGNMLNYCDSCDEKTYINFSPTHTYLNGLGADSYLSNIIMTNHEDLTASQLWAIIIERHDNPVNPITTRTNSNFDRVNIWVILGAVSSLFLVGVLYIVKWRKS